jgi:hypothetical protein
MLLLSGKKQKEKEKKRRNSWGVVDEAPPFM